MAVRFAASLGLLAFAALCLRGALRGWAFVPVVGGALMAMLVFGAVGYGIGLLARNAVRESVQREIEQAEQDARPPRAAEPGTNAERTTV